MAWRGPGEYQSPLTTFALGLFVVWFVGAFVWRTLVQRRATGDSGIRLAAFGPNATSSERLTGGLFVLALATGFAAPLAAMFGLGPLWHNDLWRLAGAGIALIGVGLTFMAQTAMGTQWRIGVDPEEHTELVTTGMFAVVRNPIFTAMLIAAVGFFLMVPNVLSATALAALWASIEIQVRRVEEPHLRKLHGESYDEYTANVGRFVPFIGRGQTGP